MKRIKSKNQKKTKPARRSARSPRASCAGLPENMAIYNDPSRFPCEAVLNSFLEPLAKTLHAKYLEDMMAAGNKDHPSVVSWEVLPEELKESNRRVARKIGENLRLLGYDYSGKNTPFPAVEQFDEATILKLAQKQHEDWMEEKQKNGWTYAPLSRGLKAARAKHTPVAWAKLTAQKQEDLAIAELRKNKHTHLLVAWSDLPEKELKKDIAIAENIIPLLKNIELKVYRTI